MMIMAIAGGAVAAVLFLGLMAAVGLHRDRGFYAALLIAIAFFYPVFSAERFDIDGALFQFLYAMPFVLIAMIGYRREPGLLATGLLLHASFDVVGLLFGFHAPELWAELCIGFDLVLALAARVFLLESTKR